MNNKQPEASIFLAVALAALVGACTSEPLISRKGVSGQALGELGAEALLEVATLGLASRPDVEIGNLATEDTNYIGGLIPVKRSAFEGRVDNGTRLLVNGRRRGTLPLVATLPRPGPHRIRLEIPVFEPCTLTLGDPVRLRMPQGEIEVWPPVIVHMLTGEIFTTRESSTVDVDRNSGTRRKTDMAKKIGRDPLLIVTTTDRVNSAWRKIGQLRVQGRPGAD